MKGTGLTLFYGGPDPLWTRTWYAGVRVGPVMTQKHHNISGTFRAVPV